MENKTKNNKPSGGKSAKSTSSNKPVSYVVVRDGRRVSPTEYSAIENAAQEYGYWSALTNKWDPTSKVEVVEKNDKLHRIY